MRDFADYNPIVLFVYFLSAAGVAMFCINPVILALSLLGAVLLIFLRSRGKSLRSHLFFLLMFVGMALINPIVNHNGVTVLFVMNDNPVTLEALIYGAASSAMIVSVIYWFRSFSQMMTGDKLLYLFGSLSPKLALILSMALRYVPLFGKQTKKVNHAQKALGLYKEDNVPDAIRGGMRVFSIMVTWALENGIITADSMAARGYGVGRRTFFSLYRFRKSDVLLLAVILLSLIGTLTGLTLGSVNFEYYPVLGSIPCSPFAVLSYISYAVLALLPSVLTIEEEIKWKSLQSKI